MNNFLKSKIKNNSRTKVIQSLPIWLPQTETWIYNQIKYLPEYLKSHIVCRNTENLDQFLLPDIHVISKNSILGRYSRSKFSFSEQRARLIWLLLNCLWLKPNVIHSHFGTTGWDDSFVVHLFKAKHIVTFYGYDVNMVPIQNPIWRNRYRALFKSADLFLCEGPHMVECIKALGCPPKKIKVHHLGVDIDNLPFNPRRWRPDEPLRILIAASFREKKGIPYALEAIGRLKSNLKIEITIIGDATAEERTRKEKTHILKKIRKNNLHAKFQMLGFQPYSVLMDQAYKHHLFLSPSITAEDGDTEGGAPLTIIEMIATGMPVVSSTHCDIPEVIIHGVTGFLAEERNSEELANHLNWFINHPEKWINFIEAGYSKIKNEFNVKSQAAIMGNLYKSVLT